MRWRYVLPLGLSAYFAGAFCSAWFLVPGHAGAYPPVIILNCLWAAACANGMLYLRARRSGKQNLSGSK